MAAAGGDAGELPCPCPCPCPFTAPEAARGAAGEGGCVGVGADAGVGVEGGAGAAGFMGGRFRIVWRRSATFFGSHGGVSVTNGGSSRDRPGPARSEIRKEGVGGRRRTSESWPFRRTRRSGAGVLRSNRRSDRAVLPFVPVERIVPSGEDSGSMQPVLRGQERTTDSGAGGGGRSRRGPTEPGSRHRAARPGQETRTGVRPHMAILAERPGEWHNQSKNSSAFIRR